MEAYGEKDDPLQGLGDIVFTPLQIFAESF
jgi:hypothetical protein